MQINSAGQMVARAYGAQGAGGVKPFQQPIIDKVGSAAKIDGLDRVELKGRVPESKAAGLVAAVVPGKVDFSGETPRQSQAFGAGGTYQMYRRPTDKVEAATVVAVGKRLDVQG